MRKKRGIAAFRFLDGPPTSFAGNLGGRFRSEEVTEEDHDRVLRETSVRRFLLRREDAVQ